jgi:hypothetical protein
MGLLILPGLLTLFAGALWAAVAVSVWWLIAVVGLGLLVLLGLYDAVPPRTLVGGPDCKRPYEMALLNVSAMSFGALSANAIRALNAGAAAGGFAHGTGEGGVTDYHLEAGGDLIWEIGSGYFGARTKHGAFDPGMFADKAPHPSVKCVSLKLRVPSPDRFVPHARSSSGVAG